MDNIRRIKRDLEALRDFTADCEEGTTRLSYTPAYKKAVQYLKEEMKACGLEIWEDGVGNLFGERKGSEKNAPKIISGSHLDTVRCSGYFDGQAGIICALEAARLLKERGIVLKGSYQVLATIMEEGARFPNLAGSRFITGEYGEEQLDTIMDADGISLRDAIIDYGLSGELGDTCRKEDNIKAFLELHVEQGVKLERSKLDLGIVETIYGARWFTVSVEGATSHPSTPMDLRRDTGIASCSLISELAELVTRDYEGKATVTFGKLAYHPNEINAVPGRAAFSIDFRSGRTEIIEELENILKKKMKEAERKYRVKMTLTLYSNVLPTPNHSVFSKIMEKEAKRLGYHTMRLDSGAGHDAMIFAKRWNTAMIFVPSKEGLTHCPEEWTDYENLAKGAEVLCSTVQILDGMNV